MKELIALSHIKVSKFQTASSKSAGSRWPSPETRLSLLSLLARQQPQCKALPPLSREHIGPCRSPLGAAGRESRKGGGEDKIRSFSRAGDRPVSFSMYACMHACTFGASRRRPPRTRPRHRAPRIGSSAARGCEGLEDVPRDAALLHRILRRSPLLLLLVVVVLGAHLKGQPEHLLVHHQSLLSLRRTGKLQQQQLPRVPAASARLRQLLSHRHFCCLNALLP